jgi:hypothetical protein
MTWLQFVLIKQAKYYAQDTGNQYSILGRQSTNSFTSFINVINLIFLLGEVKAFFNPKDSSYMYLHVVAINFAVFAISI